MSLQEKGEWFERRSLISGGATAVTIQSEQVPPGEVWQPFHASVYNGSSDTVKVQWCIVATNGNILCAADASVATLTATGTNVLPMVGPGERLGAVCTGTATAGPLTLAVSGRKFCLVSSALPVQATS